MNREETNSLKEIVENNRAVFLNNVMETIIQGIHYWADIDNIGPNRDYLNINDKYENENYTISKDTICKAMRKIERGEVQINQMLKNIIVTDNNENEMSMIDAECCDVIAQVAIFGEIVYG